MGSDLEQAEQPQHLLVDAWDGQGLPDNRLKFAVKDICVAVTIKCTARLRLASLWV